MFRDKLTIAEKAVQRKMERGTHLENDDRKVIQARMQALQRRGLWNGRSGSIPTNATNKNISVRAGDIATAFRGTANGMKPGIGSIPDNITSLVSTNVMTQVQAIGGNGGAGFSFPATSSGGVNCNWTIAGSFEVRNMTAGASGTGTGSHGYGGGTGTTSSSGSQNVTGVGVTGGAGVTSSAGVSVGASASGVGVGAGQSTTAGASVGAGYSSTTTTGVSGTQSTSGSATGSTSSPRILEQYSAEVFMTYSMSWERDVSWWNPVSWEVGVLDAATGSGAERTGSAVVGTATFEVDEPA